MSHPDYKRIGSRAVRLMEECGELIQAVAKAERFGYSEENWSKIISEFNDIEEVFQELKSQHQIK